MGWDNRLAGPIAAIWGAAGNALKAALEQLRMIFFDASESLIVIFNSDAAYVTLPVTRPAQILLPALKLQHFIGGGKPLKKKLCASTFLVAACPRQFSKSFSDRRPQKAHYSVSCASGEKNSLGPSTVPSRSALNPL